MVWGGALAHSALVLVMGAQLVSSGPHVFEQVTSLIFWAAEAAPVVRCQIISEMSRRCVPTPVLSLPSPRER